MPRTPIPLPPMVSWGCEACEVTWRGRDGACWVCGKHGTDAWVVTKGVPWTAAATITHATFSPKEPWHEGSTA